jgi:transposase
MDPPTTPPMLNHVPSEEILTKDKEAIRQLYKQAKFMPSHLSVLYNVGESTINRILRYDQITRARPTCTGRPHLLNNVQVNWIIEWLSETYRQRTLNWVKVHDELELECSVKTLEVRLKQRGYFRCVACQKPYLTPDQVHARFLWAIAHIFWHLE